MDATDTFSRSSLCACACACGASQQRTRVPPAPRTWQKIPVERNGMMSATDVMPRAKLKMSISLPAQVFFISSRAVALIAPLKIFKQ
jgi:hypothetical protein